MSTQKTCSIVLGIDPGMNTGFAIYENGKLVNLQTGSPWDMAAMIRHLTPAQVVFEDSRLQSNVWNATGTRAQACKISRNVGQIDAWCSYILAVCEQARVPVLSISPKGKGKKIDAAEFGALTGWIGQSNQHCRDAAMVAWPYRMTKSKKEAA